METIAVNVNTEYMQDKSPYALRSHAWSTQPGRPSTCRAYRLKGCSRPHHPGVPCRMCPMVLRDHQVQDPSDVWGRRLPRTGEARPGAGSYMSSTRLTSLMVSGADLVSPAASGGAGVPGNSHHAEPMITILGDAFPTRCQPGVERPARTEGPMSSMNVSRMRSNSGSAVTGA